MDSGNSKGYAGEAVNDSDWHRLENGIATEDGMILGGTDTDHHEMRMLGKIQQLNVFMSRQLHLLPASLT